jgi:ABC-2 type transport system permease protein
MVYSVGVLNGFPIMDAWWHIAALIAFMLLPILVAPKIKHAMLTYVYIP